MHDDKGLKKTTGRLLTVVFAMHLMAVQAISLNTHHHHHKHVYNNEYVQIGN